MTYRIVCTDQVPLDKPTHHAHIVSVGIDTNNDGRADEQHTKQTVIDNIRSGHHYYTYGATSRKTAYVEVVPCPQLCGLPIIRSKADAVTDNNLDNLRRCKWS
ncbi:MAG TPA: DUF3892 domain-containing protein [Magnetospirillaceae bacterium]|nr:DUF3892 domain-containing protein [Magnetospirillaceae bacterium]